MNKAITEGLDLMPPDFVDGLDVWSSGDGTAGTTTYATDPSGSLVASDPDFGDCLEIQTATSPQSLRHMGETPILPGCYLEVSARVKLISGPKPGVRVAGYPGDASGDRVSGLGVSGPTLSLDDYGRVYTVRAIVGSGARIGVDMVWGTQPVYGHFGINIVGATGAVVRVESVTVRDVTDIFHRKLMDWVDVRDYGALGDGVSDDATAFERADAAAQGREVVVPEGSYFLDRDITMLSPVRFQGTILQPDNRRFVLRADFNYPAYADAFGDETLALKKALQALFNFADHDTLDLQGRQVNLSGPIDVHAAVGNVSVMRNRRVIRGGQLTADNTPAWDPDVVTETCTYSPSNPLKLTNVANAGTIAIGSLVEGFGVGREVYVRGRNPAANELTLSQPLYRAGASQSYTFTRFKYMLDFSGFERVNQFMVDSIQFDGEGRGNGILLPEVGIWWTIRNCWFFKAGLRGITSFGDACQGITIEQCEFNASDSADPIATRKSVGFNTNKNDPKIRDCRAINLRHFGVLSGNGNIVNGNHFWSDEPDDPGDRTAGLVFTDKKSKSTITANYIDNCFMEFTNEHQADARNSSNEVFGRVSIVGNIFTGTKVADFFTFLVMKPIGNGHRMDGISVIGNTFDLFGGAVIDRVDEYDDSLGSFDLRETVDLVFEANTYGSVRQRTQSPALFDHVQAAASNVWSVDASDVLPFGSIALGVDSVTPHAPMVSGGTPFIGVPWVATQRGANDKRIDLNFPTPVSGRVQLRIRGDKPNN
ncbi:glycosyl hydrolase family 28-related protein [Oceanibium sediminis]|uniref:glycosyl hydrolase family 28-related protein n=1 Tax=Oceanibium sediminis TaxID=2026339 RepID=UPI000DD4962E|nr:glycosyl hydrolase family 28-related protein [Oceanibium sediminis]